MRRIGEVLLVRVGRSNAEKQAPDRLRNQSPASCCRDSPIRLGLHAGLALDLLVERMSGRHSEKLPTRTDTDAGNGGFGGHPQAYARGRRSARPEAPSSIRKVRIRIRSRGRKPPISAAACTLEVCAAARAAYCEERCALQSSAALPRRTWRDLHCSLCRERRAHATESLVRPHKGRLRYRPSSPPWQCSNVRVHTPDTPQCDGHQVLRLVSLPSLDEYRRRWVALSHGSTSSGRQLQSAAYFGRVPSQSAVRARLARQTVIGCWPRCASS
jgi:hypothetical protein